MDSFRLFAVVLFTKNHSIHSHDRHWLKLWNVTSSGRRQEQVPTVSVQIENVCDFDFDQEASLFGKHSWTHSIRETWNVLNGFFWAEASWKMEKSKSIENDSDRNHLPKPFDGVTKLLSSFQGRIRALIRTGDGDDQWIQLNPSIPVNDKITSSEQWHSCCAMCAMDWCSCWFQPFCRHCCCSTTIRR